MQYLKIILAAILLSGVVAFAQTGINKLTYKQYIEASAAKKTEIDIFLGNKGWAQFQPELGYILGNSMPHDGRDQCFTISTVQKNGARTQVNYKSKPCRINVYGNSFAQCHQVSDGETWEEILAAHFGEPIRNFGVGGYGTYQSYRRLLQEEKTKYSAKNLIFYIWGDDHQRSLLQSRYFAIKAWNDKMEPGYSFHGNFWPYLDFDLATGKFTEHDNKLKKPSHLYKMTDAEWLYSNLKDNLALQALLYIQGYTSDIDTEKMTLLAKWLKVDFDATDKDNLSLNLENLLNKFGYAANIFILDKLKMYVQQNNKNLLIVIFDPYKVTNAMIMNQQRPDQVMVDYLQKENFNYFDMNVVHANDFKNGNLSLNEYYAKYFVGHYDSVGNMFFAFSIKNQLVDWLQPKPVTYQNSNQQYIDFKGYLQGVK